MASQWVGGPFAQLGGSPKQLHVLVEEDPVVRSVWLKVAERKNLFLAVYDSPNEFLNNLTGFPKSTKFYLDQDFGPNNRGVGVGLARLIKRRLGAFTCLVTSYNAEQFVSERTMGVLDAVSDKHPAPFEATEKEIYRSFVDVFGEPSTTVNTYPQGETNA